jgi:hypothetical protein
VLDHGGTTAKSKKRSRSDESVLLKQSGFQSSTHLPRYSSLKLTESHLFYEGAPHDLLLECHRPPVRVEIHLVRPLMSDGIRIPGVKPVVVPAGRVSLPDYRAGNQLLVQVLVLPESLTIMTVKNLSVRQKPVGKSQTSGT